MHKVRILHISDLHISSDFAVRNVNRIANRPFLHDPSQLQEAIRRFTDSNGGYDGLLISGDIADSGEKKDIDRVKALLIQPPLPQSLTTPSTLEGLSLFNSFVAGQVAVLPGNSDRFCSWQNGMPGCATFDASLSTLWKRGQNGVQSFRFNEALVIICGDCTLKKREHAYQHSPRRQGMVYDETLEALVRLTNLHHDDGLAVVWAFHFPPVAPPGFELATGLIWSERKLCRGETLVNAALDCGVRHIFCGHAHYSSCFEVENKVWIHCAGTSACTGNHHHSTIHDLQFVCHGTSVDSVVNKRLRWNGSAYEVWRWENSEDGIMVVS